jgi:hypothetical protein
MNSALEKWFPLSLSVLIAVAVFFIFYKYSLSLPTSMEDILTAATTLSSITVGFLAASQAVLLSINQEKVVKNLKEAGVYRKLIGYLMDAIHWSFILALSSSIGLAIDFSKVQHWHTYAFSGWIFIVCTTFLSCYRILKLFNRVLRSMS